MTAPTGRFRGTDSRSGFSLLEVLVGLAIAGFVLLSAFRLFETAPRLQARTDAALIRLQELFELHERMVAIAAAHAEDGRLDDPAFEPTRLRSRTLGTVAGPLPGAKTFELGGDAQGVYLDYPVHDRMERRRYGFAEIAFSYAGAARPGQWLDTWPRDLRSPNGVRVKVVAAPGDRPYEFVIRLSGQRPGICLLLPDDPTCQR